MRILFFLIAGLGGLLFWSLVAICVLILVFAAPYLFTTGRRENSRKEAGGIDDLF